MDDEYHGILWDDIDKILSQGDFQPIKLIRIRNEFMRKADSIHTVAVEQRKWKLAHDVLALLLRVQNKINALPSNTPETKYIQILEDNFPLLDEIERGL